MTNPDADCERLRIPPHSIEAEQSVLGGLLLDNLAWDRIADEIGEADFYAWPHRAILNAVAWLINQGKPADVVTVHERITALGQDVGGLAYLNSLAQSVPGASNIRRYAEIVRERAVFRRLIEAVDNIGSTAFDPKGRPATAVLDEAEGRILKIGEDHQRRGAEIASLDALTARVIDRLSTLADNGPQFVSGVATGFVDLDHLTTGFQPGDLVVLAARPSMGKTAAALNMAEHASVVGGLPVMIFSMEMSADQIALRMFGATGRIDQTKMRTGALDDDDWSRVSEAAERLSRVKCYVDDTPALNPVELRARARRTARRAGGKLGLVIVDYLQLMTSAGKPGENRATELSEITRSLKALAKELHCPVVALSQLNRTVESRNDKRPIMSDLRESGAIEQDADLIMFIYRDDYYNKDSREPGVAEFIIAKQRNGPVGTIKLVFQNRLARFANLASDRAG